MRTWGTLAERPVLRGGASTEGQQRDHRDPLEREERRVHEEGPRQVPEEHLSQEHCDAHHPHEEHANEDRSIPIDVARDDREDHGVTRDHRADQSELTVQEGRGEDLPSDSQRFEEEARKEPMTQGEISEEYDRRASKEPRERKVDRTSIL